MTWRGVSVSFDEANLVPSAGLLPAALLARRAGLAALVQKRVRLARQGANSGAKALSLIGAVLVGANFAGAVAKRSVAGWRDLFTTASILKPAPGEDHG